MNGIYSARKRSNAELFRLEFLVMPKSKFEEMWAVAGKHGLYTGTWLTRSEAISSHTRSRLVIPCDKWPTLESGWRYLKRKGDRTVKVTIRYQA